MALSARAASIYDQLTAPGVKLGDVRRVAKEVKKDHDLASELWGTGAFLPRQLAILIMDKANLDQDSIDRLDADMRTHPAAERDRLADWLLANQLRKDKRTIGLLESWQHSPSPLQRRLFWYHQARLRWTGQEPPPNTDALLDAIDEDLAGEEPEVQWAMNFAAGWIGVHDPSRRDRCVEIGERVGLYKDEAVAPNCTPSYLPEFIRIEVAKLS